MKKLTVIIPFLNEGEEVQNTVESIKTHGGIRRKSSLLMMLLRTVIIIKELRRIMVPVISNMLGGRG